LRYDEDVSFEKGAGDLTAYGVESGPNNWIEDGVDGGSD